MVKNIVTQHDDNALSVEPLKDRVIEMLRRQIEFAFESDVFYLESSDEYLVIDLTLRADTNEEIKRRYHTETEIHVQQSATRL